MGPAGAERAELKLPATPRRASAAGCYWIVTPMGAEIVRI
jgi:hypothetical protein